MVAFRGPHVGVHLQVRTRRRKRRRWWERRRCRCSCIATTASSRGRRGGDITSDRRCSNISGATLAAFSIVVCAVGETSSVDLLASLTAFGGGTLGLRWLPPSVAALPVVMGFGCLTLAIDLRAGATSLS